MSKTKFSPAVYAALRDADMSNRQIARELGVNESSVRRGLKDAEPKSSTPVRRALILIEEGGDTVASWGTIYPPKG